jgi:hypothetical protein
MIDGQIVCLEGLLSSDSTLQVLVDEIVKLGHASAGAFSVLIPQGPGHPECTTAFELNVQDSSTSLESCGLFTTMMLITLRTSNPAASMTRYKNADDDIHESTALKSSNTTAGIEGGDNGIGNQLQVADSAGFDGVRSLLPIADSDDVGPITRKRALYALSDIGHAGNQIAAAAEGVRVLLRIADSEDYDSGVREGASNALGCVVKDHAYNQSAAGAEGVRVLICIADSEDDDSGVREQALTAFFMLSMVTRRIKSWLLMVQCLLLIVF